MTAAIVDLHSQVTTEARLAVATMVEALLAHWISLGHADHIEDIGRVQAPFDIDKFYCIRCRQTLRLQHNSKMEDGKLTLGVTPTVTQEGSLRCQSF